MLLLPVPRTLTVHSVLEHTAQKVPGTFPYEKRGTYKIEFSLPQWRNLNYKNKTETSKMMEVFVLWREVYWSKAHSVTAVRVCWREVHESIHGSSSFLRGYL